LISFCCFSTFSIKAFSFYFLFYVIMNLVLFFYCSYFVFKTEFFKVFDKLSWYGQKKLHFDHCFHNSFIFNCRNSSFSWIL
jgi:hypothetical protein